MESLAFFVYGDPERDDFSKAKPYLEWLRPRVRRLVTVLVPGTVGSSHDLDFPGWARWATAEGLGAALILPQLRLSELPWAGPGIVEDLPVFFLRPPVDGEFGLLAAELEAFFGSDTEIPEDGEFVLGASPDSVWLRAHGGPELFSRLPFLVDYLRRPPVAAGESDPRWEVVQLRNTVFEKETALSRARRDVARYRRFFDDDITGDFVAGPGGRVVDCNRAFARIFGFPSVDYALGLDLRRLFTSRQELRRIVALFAPGFRLEDRELDLVRPDGRRVSVIANLTGLRGDNGRLAQIRGFLFDNTPRKALETQLLEAQKMEGLGRLAGGIAHDFNNLLTVINGYTELLLADEGPGRTELEQVLQAGLKAAELTRQLLAFSRRQTVDPQNLDLGEVVSQMEVLVRRLLTERVQLVIDREPGPQPFVADRGQIEQVILNLVINARDAMPDGGVLSLATRTVVLGTSTYEGDDLLLPGTYVRLTVADSGVGMDLATREKAFEPFFTTKAQGTGLGLALVRDIVTRTGGHLRLTTQPGHGTTFALWFDQTTTPSSPTLPRPVVPQPLAAQGIVVVEDDRAVLEYIERILLRQGYRVAAFSSAEEALELLEAGGEGWSAVVSDLVLPGMTGQEFLHKLQGLGIDIPFLSMSGYTDDEILRHGMDPRTIVLLHKPFQSRDLVRAIANLLEASQE